MHYNGQANDRPGYKGSGTLSGEASKEFRFLVSPGFSGL
jgi:hypothetical protein